MRLTKPKIIVVDDNVKETDPLLVDLRELYGEVRLFSDTPATIEYIKKNLESRMIVLLDIRFAMEYEQDNGFMTLAAIRKLSDLIPVILWSGLDKIEKKNIQDSITEHVFAFLEQGVGASKEIIQTIQAAEAEQNLQVGTAIEEWICQQPKELQNEEPYIVTTSGISYTLKQVLKEIRLRTEFGRGIEKSILKLTINRLSRQKEHLDD